MAGDHPKGWVSNDQQRRAREAELRELEGHSIQAARYFELDYEGISGPSWEAQDFDALDFGLELDLDDGTTLAIIWQTASENETLLAYRGHLEPDQIQIGAAALWDASQRWLDKGPSEIEDVNVAWLRSGADLCLQTIVLTGGTRQAVLTLGDSESGGFVLSATSVAVFFSIATARGSGVVLPGDPRAA